MAKDRREKLLGELERIADRLDENDGLYRRRLEIFRELRSLDPPVPQRVIAEHSRITEVAVTQVLRKARLQDESNGRSAATG